MGLASIGARTLLRGLGKTGGALGFGAAYAGDTAIGYNETGGLFGYNKRNTYSSRYPSNFKLPYYRYRTSRYGRRYGRRTYGRRYSRFGSRKRFFSRYRTRRFY